MILFHVELEKKKPLMSESLEFKITFRKDIRKMMHSLKCHSDM